MTLIEQYKVDRFELDRTELFMRLRFPDEGEMAEEIMEVADRVAAVLRPQAVVREVVLDAVTDSEVRVGTFRFQSAELAWRLRGLERAFAYIATAGSASEQQIANYSDDPLHHFIAESVAEMGLSKMFGLMQLEVQNASGEEQLVTMNPGSGDVSLWPVDQQPELFALLGEGVQQVGVELNSSCLMTPTKSLSGFLFRGTEDFESCTLCRRAGCSERRAPFDLLLWESHGLSMVGLAGTSCEPK